jgi:hypothetical protein
LASAINKGSKIMVNAKFSNDSVITVLVSSCPKRAGTKSAATWAVYKTGQTVAQYAEAHKKANAHYTPAACLAWDTKHGFVSVKAAPAALALKSKPVTK